MPRTIPLAASIAALLLLVAFAPAPPIHAAPADEGPPSVIAYLDTGINPYHGAFRAPDWTDHPSTYIPGYPTSAQPLNLTLEADSFEQAWQADEDVWTSVERHQLYYVPGTRIVGAINVDNTGETGNPVYDEHGHGTMVADAGSGHPRGTAPSSAIVMIAGGHRENRWVLGQSWIDIYSRSLGDLGHVGVPVSTSGARVATAYEITQRGRSVVNAAGNGPVPVNTLGSMAGPPWMVTVGGVEGEGTQDRPYSHCAQCGRPYEVAAERDGDFASTDATNGTEPAAGTSFSAPRVAGYLARLVDDARDRLGDTGNVHTHPGLYARAADGVEPPDVGPLADGELNRTELEDTLRRTADADGIWTGTRHRGDPVTVDPRQASYWWQGYGVVNSTTYDHARQVLLGEAAMPDRPQDDAWHDRFDRLARAYWAPWVCASQADGDLTRWPGCWTEQVPGAGD